MLSEISFPVFSTVSFCLELLLNRKFRQVLHKYPQRNIIGVYRSSLSTASVQVGIVGGGRIQSGHQKPALGFVLITDHESRNGCAGIHDQARIGLGGLQELPESRVLFFFLIAFFTPGSDRFSMKNDHLEEGIQEQNGVRPNAVGVQQDRCGWTVKTVGKEGWLDHYQRVRRILLDQVVAMSRCLIGTGVEYIQKLRSSKVEHELRIHAKFRCQVETGWIVDPVLGKFGAQANQRAIDPPKNIGKFVRVRLVDG
mmetsp:Transcript_1639/g.3632  ORF Transcript_1639/g.3632 Transcript_1639/m.3632 type:complete len:254 (+) Transcript_1639:2603-3364(+)